MPVAELVERSREAAKAYRSRREFLRAAAGGAAALAAAPLLSACGDDGGDGDGGDVQVAVIGAGMAGLHCAYRLDQAGVNVRVFEASGRTGGRMFTARGMLPENQIAELGGEMIDTDHESLRGLAEELGFALDDLSAGTVGETYYFNDQFIDLTQVVEEFIPVAAAMENAVITGEASDDEFARLDAMSIPEWLENEAHAMPLIAEILNVAYTGEYGLEGDVQSVWNLLYLIDYDTPDPFRLFGDSDERYHVHLGNESVPGRLAELLGDRVELNTVLTAVARSGSRYRLTFSRDSGTREETFDHVVLALPFTLLREVDLSDAGLPDEKLEVIQQLGYGTNTKLIGSFTSRMWNIQLNASGTSFSDLGYIETWDSSRGQDGAHGVLTDFLGGQAGLDAGQGTAEERMQMTLDQLDLVYPGVKDAYVPNSALRFFWPGAPFNKGSYASYLIGQWAFYGIEGERVDNIHFCGEHTSLDFQGYMEGASESGARAAMEVLDDLGIAAGPALRRVAGSRLIRPARIAGVAPLHGRRLMAERRRNRSLNRARVARNRIAR